MSKVGHSIGSLARVLMLVALLGAGLAAPAGAGGFLDLVYAPATSQEGDFDGLADAPSMGFIFGYEAGILSTDMCFNVELGYETGTQEIDALDDPDMYFRTHRGFLGLRLKYAGLGYIRPYFGGGVMAYAYYEASDDLAALGVDDYEISKNLGGSYTVFGIDFSYAADSMVAFGIEQRNMKFTTKDEDTGDIEKDADVRRLALKFNVRF
ncbi:MAG: hypothetical protein ABIF71_03565 [Planctomycetota bacterium]